MGCQPPAHSAARRLEVCRNPLEKASQEELGNREIGKLGDWRIEAARLGSVVKLTFAKGASLEDPSRLFNSSLEGNVRRAIDIREGEHIDEPALNALVRKAVALTKAGRPKPSKEATS
jgi:hypothetical protein